MNLIDIVPNKIRQVYGDYIVQSQSYDATYMKSSGMVVVGTWKFG